MAKEIVPVSKFPNAPPVQGVPSLFRDPTAIFFPALLLAADVLTVLRLFQGPQWGVFTSGGAPVILADSVVTVDFRNEYRISDYPVEQGGFQSYNKVQVPYDIRVRLSCDGGTIPRELFLLQVANAMRALDLFVVVTPDAVYPSVNIVHYDYRRERQGGVGIIQVDLWLEEVRVTVTTQFTNTKESTSQADTNIGTVQPTAPTPSQAAALPTPPIPPANAPLFSTTSPVVDDGLV